MEDGHPCLSWSARDLASGFLNLSFPERLRAWEFAANQITSTESNASVVTACLNRSLGSFDELITLLGTSFNLKPVLCTSVALPGKVLCLTASDTNVSLLAHNVHLLKRLHVAHDSSLHETPARVQESVVHFKLWKHGVKMWIKQGSWTQLASVGWLGAGLLPIKTLDISSLGVPSHAVSEALEPAVRVEEHLIDIADEGETSDGPVSKKRARSNTTRRVPVRELRGVFEFSTSGRQKRDKMAATLTMLDGVDVSVTGTGV